MKIREIFIEGFGHFHDELIGPFDRPVTILYGPNEAGKSTLLAFIRTMLFGFPLRLGQHHFPPLAGGQHGGRLTLADNKGGRFVVERFQGSKGGHLRITTGDGAPMAESSLPGLIGHVSQDVFESVFAFSLDELQSGQFLKDDSVNGQIYSAGIGASTLPAALREIKSKKEKLFLKGGSKHEVAGVLAQLREIEGELDQLRGDADEYGTLVARRTAIDQETEAIKSERTDLQKRFGELERLREGWADWLSLAEIDADLAKLPRIESFPEDAVVRLESAEKAIDDRKVDLDDAVAGLKRAEAQASAPVIDEDLLNHRSSVERIRRGRSSLDNSVKDLPKLKITLLDMEKALDKRIRDLSPDWDEQNLESFDLSISVQDDITRAQQGHADLDQELRERRSQFERAGRDLIETREAELEARRRVEQADEPRFDIEGIVRRRNEIRTARTRWDEYERVRLRHQDIEAQLESGATTSAPGGGPVSAQKWLQPTLLAMAGVAVIVLGALAGGAALLFSIGLGVALTAAAAYVVISGAEKRRSASAPAISALEERVRASGETVSEAGAALRKAAATLGLDDADGDGLDMEEAGLDAADDVLQATLLLQGRLQQAGREAQIGERRVSQASEALEETTVKLEIARREWRGWLRERRVPEKFTPDTMAEFRTQVDAARLQLDKVTAMRPRVKDVEADIRLYRDLTAPLVLKFGIQVRSEGGDQVAISGDRLIERYDIAVKQVEARGNALADVRREQQAREKQGQRLEQAAATLAQLLEAAGAATPEELRQRAAWRHERSALEREQRERLRSLERLCGPGQDVTRFRWRLETTTQQEIEDQLTQLSQEAVGVSAQRDKLSEERGGIETRLKQLVGDQESSGLHVRRNVLIEQLLDHAGQWSRLSLAEDLLHRARRKFEAERQPGVIQHARGVFESITRQRYSQLYAPLGEQTVTVMDRVGPPKEPAELSRGTREQLYLALRIGLIREFGDKSERLPVIVDEVLVNFDPDRAERAATAFAELSRTNQLLVFTCHPHLVDLFTSVIDDAQVIEVGSSGPPPG